MVGGQPGRLLHRSARAGRYAGNAALLPRTPDHNHRRGDRVQNKIFSAHEFIYGVRREKAALSSGCNFNFGEIIRRKLIYNQIFK